MKATIQRTAIDDKIHVTDEYGDSYSASVIARDGLGYLIANVRRGDNERDEAIQVIDFGDDEIQISVHHEDDQFDGDDGCEYTVVKKQDGSLVWEESA